MLPSRDYSIVVNFQTLIIGISSKKINMVNLIIDLEQFNFFIVKTFPNYPTSKMISLLLHLNMIKILPS
jgi:hypothetical protein